MYFIIIFLTYSIGIGIIKKDSKNLIVIKPEFYEFYNNNLKNIITLNEEDNEIYADKRKKKEKKYKINIIKIDNEIEEVKRLINIVNDLLKNEKLEFEKKNKEYRLVNKEYPKNCDNIYSEECIKRKMNKNIEPTKISKNNRKHNNNNGKDIQNSKISDDFKICLPTKLFLIKNNKEQNNSFESEKFEKSNDNIVGQEKEKVKEKENNYFIYNKNIYSNNDSRNNFWFEKNNIQERKDESILSSSSFEKENFIDLDNYS